MIDAATAENETTRSARAQITTRGEAREYEVVGVSRFGSVKSLGVATTSVFDLRAAQEMFHKQRPLRLDPRGRS